MVSIPSALGAAGPTLYVDQANPNCSNSGAGTPSQPFCTISATSSKVVPGTTVQVAAGTYNERVSVKSGTAESPVVYTAAPGASVTVTGQASGFVASGKSWVTINGFTVRNTTSYGIEVSSGASNVTVSNNNVSYAGQPASGFAKYGIRFSAATDSVAIGNTVHHNSDTGIAIVGSSARIRVLNNHTFANARGYSRAAAGIRVTYSSDNVIAGNNTHDNEDSGIEAYTGAAGTLIYNNLTYDNGDHGIDNLSTTNQRVIGNTVYKNVTAGINVEGSSTGAVVVNNIAVDNGIKSPRTRSNIRIERGSTTGAVVDYNQVWLTVQDTLYIWDSTSYTTLAAFRAASGQGAHEIWADPRWRDVPGRDFHLTWASPAVDSADSGVSGQAATDLEGTSRIDDPFVADTGAGPRSYDDRGAYELGAGDMDAPPLARLTVTPTSGPFPLTVTADASASTDPDPTPIATYSFDFGDGAVTGPQTQPTAGHTYTAAGVYTVRVTVTDTAGEASTATATVTAVDLPPTANLSVTPVSGHLPMLVTADGSASRDDDPTPVATYTFDFGDGTVVGPQASATAQHLYTVKGSYTVTLTVSDTAGLSSTATSTVTVRGPEPTASLTVTPSSGGAPLAVTADASASFDDDSTPIATYNFDFGDGTVTGPQAQATAGHTYVGAGNYTVTVTVVDTGGNASTATASVTVLDSPPTVALTVSPSSGSPPLDVTADASGSSDNDSTPIATYDFDFGDGTVTGPQPGATAAHTYTNDGSYTVTVTVKDTAGNATTATRQVTVGAPTAALTVNPTAGISPVTVTADASGSTDSGPTPIATYNFDFGDGAVTGPQAEPSSSHTYSAAGTYTVKVTVTDAGGLTSTASSQVVVTHNFAGNSGFEANLNGWNTSGSEAGITLARVAGGHSGDWAAQLTNGAAGPASCLLNDAPNWVISTAAGTYTARLWVRADTAGATLKLRLRTFNGATAAGSIMQQFALTTSWQEVSVSLAAAAGLSLDLNAYVTGAAPGVCFYADDVVITRG